MHKRNYRLETAEYFGEDSDIKIIFYLTWCAIHIRTALNSLISSQVISHDWHRSGCLKQSKVPDSWIHKLFDWYISEKNTEFQTAWRYPFVHLSISHMVHFPVFFYCEFSYIIKKKVFKKLIRKVTFFKTKSLPV